jgi:hypothetical protein
MELYKEATYGLIPSHRIFLDRHLSLRMVSILGPNTALEEYHAWAMRDWQLEASLMTFIGSMPGILADQMSAVQVMGGWSDKHSRDEDCK